MCKVYVTGLCNNNSCDSIQYTNTIQEVGGKNQDECFYNGVAVIDGLLYS